MTAVYLFLGGLLVVAIALGAKTFLNLHRRRKLLVAPPDPAWEKILKKRFPTFFDLPEDLRHRLTGIMQVFIHEKRFEACGGLREVTEEMRVLIAVQACLLLVGIEKHGFFPRLRSILIYPDAYRDRRRRTFDIQTENNDVRLGESWNSGSVVLAWKSVVDGAKGEDDGINVVFHEFAHQLDQLDHAADGAPPLSNRGDYQAWARIFHREYEALVEAAQNPASDPLFDTYGAENPAEFFAVATESFFEMPREVKEEHPELYEQLSIYYGIDPTVWKG